jgi:hypothetical protein
MAAILHAGTLFAIVFGHAPLGIRALIKELFDVGPTKHDLPTEPNVWERKSSRLAVAFERFY